MSKAERIDDFFSTVVTATITIGAILLVILSGTVVYNVIDDMANPWTPFAEEVPGPSEPFYVTGESADVLLLDFKDNGRSVLRVQDIDCPCCRELVPDWLSAHETVIIHENGAMRIEVDGKVVWPQGTITAGEWVTVE